MKVIQPRQVFLLDALGAFASAVASGIILPQFSDLLGIEPGIFRALAVLALVFMLYDLTVYFFALQPKKWMGKLLIGFNLGYCLLTTCLILWLPTISVFGMAVLVFEIFIVLAVVWFELRTL